eukprot:TRINITY_DN3345_c0_g1_i6.p1 TRINITY_DN3345_c0_g1~~TRINITY_DN3345_c0_g1_i6.p1  ORF type:complete len:1852 (+),score=332.85 TRINITY_DN3345_c0_g1_i6:629-5557(+)
MISGSVAQRHGIVPYVFEHQSGTQMYLSPDQSASSTTLLMAADVWTGTVLWTYQPPGGVGRSFPTVSPLFPDLVFVSYQGPGVSMLDAQTGTPYWESQSGISSGQVYYPVISSLGVFVFCDAYRASMMRFDRGTGAVQVLISDVQDSRWQFSAPPVALDTTLYFGTLDGALQMFSLEQAVSSATSLGHTSFVSHLAVTPEYDLIVSVGSSITVITGAFQFSAYPLVFSAECLDPDNTTILCDDAISVVFGTIIPNSAELFCGFFLADATNPFANSGCILDGPDSCICQAPPFLGDYLSYELRMSFDAEHFMGAAEAIHLEVRFSPIIHSVFPSIISALNQTTLLTLTGSRFSHGMFCEFLETANSSTPLFFVASSVVRADTITCLAPILHRSSPVVLAGNLWLRVSLDNAGFYSQSVAIAVTPPAQPTIDVIPQVGWPLAGGSRKRQGRSITGAATPLPLSAPSVLVKDFSTEWMNSAILALPSLNGDLILGLQGQLEGHRQPTYGATSPNIIWAMSPYSRARGTTFFGYSGVVTTRNTLFTSLNFFSSYYIIEYDLVTGRNISSIPAPSGLDIAGSLVLDATGNIAIFSSSANRLSLVDLTTGLWTAVQLPILQAPHTLCRSVLSVTHAVDSQNFIYAMHRSAESYAAVSKVSIAGVISWTFFDNVTCASSPSRLDTTLLLNSLWDVYPVLSDDDSVLFVPGGLAMHALSTATGAVLWSFAVSLPTAPALSVDGQTLYFGAIDGDFFALDTASGTERWRWTFSVSLWAPPLVDTEAILVGDSGGRISCLSSQGMLQWAITSIQVGISRGGAILVSPWLMPNGDLAVVYQDNGVVLFGPSPPVMRAVFLTEPPYVHDNSGAFPSASQPVIGILPHSTIPAQSFYRVSVTVVNVSPLPSPGPIRRDMAIWEGFLSGARVSPLSDVATFESLSLYGFYGAEYELIFDGSATTTTVNSLVWRLRIATCAEVSPNSVPVRSGAACECDAGYTAVSYTYFANTQIAPLPRCELSPVALVLTAQPSGLHTQGAFGSLPPALAVQNSLGNTFMFAPSGVEVSMLVSYISPAVSTPSALTIEPVGSWNRTLISGLASFAGDGFVAQYNSTLAVEFSVIIFGISLTASFVATTADCNSVQPFSEPTDDALSCVCRPGYLISGSTATCQQCDANTFNPSPNADSCTPCPRNAVSPSGSTQLADCVCLGGYYAVFDGASSFECVECPTGAVCVNSGIQPRPGYFQPPGETGPPRLYECPNPAACLADGNCAEGYRGVLCAACDTGYASVVESTCAACPNRAASVVLLLVSLGVLAIGMAILIRSSQHERSKVSIGLKIFISFLQTVAFVGAFGLPFPSVASGAFQVLTVSTASSRMFSIECVFGSDFISHLIFTMCLPAIVLSCVLVVHFGAQLARGHISLGDQWKTAVLVVLYVLHPSITQQVLKIYPCVDVGGDSFLEADVTISCSSSRYTAARAAASVFLVVYCVGMLVGLFLLLRRNAPHFSDPSHEVTAQYRFLIGGLSSEHYFWEIAVTTRKLLIVLFSVFLSDSLQIFAALLLITFFIHATSRLAPFASPAINRLETIALWSVQFILLLSSLLLSGHLSDPGRQAVSGFIVATVLAFTAAVAAFVAHTTHEAIAAKRQPQSEMSSL